MIDLSGQSPGILYALEAENIGQAWAIGRYLGCLNLASTALNRTLCEKNAAAWALFEPYEPSSIPVQVMHSLGAQSLVRYKHLGS